jgi:hypothetical protein
MQSPTQGIEDAELRKECSADPEHRSGTRE